MIEFAVRDSRARAHTLRLAGTNYGAGAKAVLVLERAFENVGDNLHVAMRVHAPDIFGDPFNRGLTAKAAKSGSDEVGLELGKLGALGMRASAPYRENGNVIGFIQLAVEFEHIADTLHEVLGVDVLTLIDKRKLARDEWEKGEALFHWPLPWDRLPAVTLNDSTMPVLPEPLIQRIATAQGDGTITPGYLRAGSRILYLAPLDLLDSAGQRLGSLVIVIDRTTLITSSRCFMAAIALLCLALAIGLVVLFHRIIRKVERRIEHGIAGLARTTADLERVAFMACHELQAPLDQVMTTSLELEHGGGPLDADGVRHLQAVMDGAKTLERTIGTLEDYLDLDINARPMETVDLGAVFAAALEKIQPLTDDDRITLAPLPKVLGRPILLARAALCILDSILKARLPEQPLQITVSAEGQDGLWRICFAGLPQSPRILAPILESRSELAIARRIAQVHGGDLGFVTVPPDGTAILLTLGAAPRS